MRSARSARSAGHAAAPRSALLRLLLSAWVGLWVATAPARADADAATEAKIRFEQARAAQDQGIAARRRGDVAGARAAFGAALSEFMTSNRLSPNFTTAFNVGWCLEALGLDHDAYGAFVDAGRLARTDEHRALHAQAIARLEARVPQLELDTEPRGAAIFLDREELGQYGVTPRRFAAPPGIHRFILKADGYRTATGTIALAPGVVATRQVRLQRETGRLAVVTHPPGAEVRLGSAEGPPLGVAPLVADVSIGEARLVAQLPGHVAQTALVTVRSSTTTRAELTLTALPAPRGRVYVQTNVAAALVEVDGAESGFSPAVLELTEGGHVVRVTKPGHQSWETQLVVDPRRTQAVDVTLALARPAEPHGPLSRVLWVGAGLGAAAATALGIHTLSLDGAYRDDPSRARLDGIDRAALATDLSWVGAAVLAVAGSLVWLYEESSLPDASRGEVSASGGRP